MTSYDAIVLAGGRSRRFGGTDKTGLDLGGRSLLDRVLEAVCDANLTVVVGPRRPTPRTVSWTVERPVGGGPAAALCTALPLANASQVVLLAADMPFVTASTVQDLLAVATPSGAVAVTEDGREQWLLSAWPTAVLRRADLVAGGSLHAALRPLGPTRWPVTWRTAMDCDTPAELQLARELSAAEPVWHPH